MGKAARTWPRQALAHFARQGWALAGGMAIAGAVARRDSLDLLVGAHRCQVSALRRREGVREVAGRGAGCGHLITPEGGGEDF